MPDRGLLVVLEGSDGSGKATQFNLLGERLKAAGYDVAVFDFPRYEKRSSYFVKQYLGGQYGPTADISPYTASLFYALDRYEAAGDIQKAVDGGQIVLINRYVGSNMAHQGAKFADPVEQRGFFVWEDNLEYQLLGIPRPDINFFLRVPAAISQKLIKERAAKTGSALDEHERDLGSLKKSLDTYDLLCRLFPKDFLAIECTKDDRLMNVAEINNLIWARLKPLLPANKPHAGHSTVVTLSGPSAKPAPSDDPEGRLVQRFKDASLFLKLNVERYVKSVDPPGLSIWSDFDYKFYTPMGLPKDVETAYKATMEKLAALHGRMREILEDYYEKRLLTAGQTAVPNISELLLPVTPLAALCGFKAVMPARTAQRLAAGLLASDSLELQWAAKQIFMAARQQWPDNFNRPLESSDNPEPINNIIAKLTEDKLSLNSGDRAEVKLVEALPRQEFSLLAESIFPYSSLSLDEISDEVSSWSYRQKYDSLRQAAADPAVVEKVRYKFDMITDQIVMAEMAGRATLDNLQAQQPSPRFGYEVPGAAEDAGIDELYLECFDESLKLFSILQQADRDDLTVYATLLGHKLRWQFSSDAGKLKLLLDGRSGGNYGHAAEAVYEAVGEVHPLIWDILAGPGGTPPIPPAKKNRVKPSKRRPAKRRSNNPKKS